MHSPTTVINVAQKLAAGLAAVLTIGSLNAVYAAPKTDSSGTVGRTPYIYYVTGNPTPDPVISQKPSGRSTVLMGGGEDVDRAFQWMIQRAGITPGTGGRFVVIRASGADGYNPYVWYSNYPTNTDTTSQPRNKSVGGAAMGLSSMETLVIPSREAANDDFVQKVVRRADAIFIAGGDQADYINNWKGTRLHDLLDAKVSANTPIGGTSAGLAVLGNYDFAALRGSVTSTLALSDPFNRYMTIDPMSISARPFLNVAGLAYTITDAHVDERDRMGRLITFVSRLIAPTTGTGCAGGFLPAFGSGNNYARGIGLGIETALLVEEEGTGQFYGTRVTNPVDATSTSSKVYFVRPTREPKVCAQKMPLTIEHVEIATVGAEPIRIDMTSWSNLRFGSHSISNGTFPGYPY